MRTIHPYPLLECCPVGFLIVFIYSVLASHQGLDLSPCPWMVEKDRQALSHLLMALEASHPTDFQISCSFQPLLWNCVLCCLAVSHATFFLALWWGWQFLVQIHTHTIQYLFFCFRSPRLLLMIEPPILTHTTKHSAANMRKSAEKIQN